MTTVELREVHFKSPLNVPLCGQHTKISDKRHRRMSNEWKDVTCEGCIERHINIEEKRPNFPVKSFDDFVWEEISPEKAIDYLEEVEKREGIHNRTLKQDQVNFLKYQMLTNQWYPEAEGTIMFDKEGILRNGQHRMYALIEANMTLWFRVQRNTPEHIIKVVDTNKVRTVSDNLKMDNYSESPSLSSAVNFLHQFEQTLIFKELRKSEIPALTVRDVEHFIETHPRLQDMIPIAKKLHKNFGGGYGRWTSLCHILYDSDDREAKPFLDKLLTGTSLAPGDAVLALRNILFNNKGYAHNRKMTEIEYAALVFKSWNLWIDGKSVYRLNWRGGGNTPEAFPIPKGYSRIPITYTG